ncbi:MAG: hypothetical protein ACYDHX_16275 [Methanothrix sp.]
MKQKITQSQRAAVNEWIKRTVPASIAGQWVGSGHLASCDREFPEEIHCRRHFELSRILGKGS